MEESWEMLSARQLVSVAKVGIQKHWNPDPDPDQH